MIPVKRKNDGRQRPTLAYKGNAQVLEAALDPKWFRRIQHPNRMLEQYRAFYKRKGAA